jgi:hypothetical protein
MRKKIVIGLGAATAVATLSMGVGAALAAPAGPLQGVHTTIAAAHKKITRAEAKQIAKAKVPHSHVIEIESDDHHDRAVWKVTLGTPKGRVIVDVDKKTGKATIIHKSGGQGPGGHDNSVGAMALSDHRSSGHDSARDAREDRGEDRRDDRGADRRDHDGRGHHGDRHDHDGGHDHDGAGHDQGDN